MNSLRHEFERRGGGKKLMQSIDIQGYSYEPSEPLLRRLNRSLVKCGGWVLDRRATSSATYEIIVEIELRFVLELYTALIASGLELTRGNHLVLTDLCTCRLHLLGKNEMRQTIGMRIEVSFLKQLTLHNLLTTGCSVA